MKLKPKEHRGYKKLAEKSVEIRQNENPESQDKGFIARQLVQATLPHSEPKGNPIDWCRTNGNFTLSIRPGVEKNPKTGKSEFLGYPFGTIPRLLLFWMTTEAIRTKSRKLELGDTLANFMKTLNLDPHRGGKRSDAVRLKDQMKRLFASTVSFEYSKQYSDSRLETRMNINIASKSKIWWSEKDPAQVALFGSWIELGYEFYEDIIKAPVPVDMRALRALKQSPLALDLYAWSTYRTFTAFRKGKSQLIPWKALEYQIGCDYKRLIDFKVKARHALLKIQSVYPDLRIEELDNKGFSGLVIHPSRPAVMPKL